MNARAFSHLCRFKGGLPSLVFRDHEGGRIKVFMLNKWIATVVPQGLLCDDTPVLLSLGVEPEIEWRGTYEQLAIGLSELQQTADWEAADTAFYDARYAFE